MIAIPSMYYILIATNKEEREYLKTLHTFLGAEESNNAGKYIHTLAIESHQPFPVPPERNLIELSVEQMQKYEQHIYNCAVMEWRQK